VASRISIALVQVAAGTDSEYSTRVRLRWFVDEVRMPGSIAGQLAEEAGYSRYHNLLDALGQRTGLTPSEVRQLSHNDVRELLDVRLGLAVTPAVSR